MVLVVEDDGRIAESLGEMLRHLGCSALWAHDPDQALRMMATTRIDVVLSDMVMPGASNGLDLARIVRQRGDAVQVILMTGYSDDAERARQEGFVILDKPFTLDALVAALNGAEA
jgi:CheY-like chemotaxis protein